MSLMSESSCASTVKDTAGPNFAQPEGLPKRFSPANSVTPSVAYQSGWNPAPSTAQHMWANQNAQLNGHMRGMSDPDSQSIISMSSSISQNHLRIAQQRMEKRQRKKLSKSAQSVGVKSHNGNGSGSSGSSRSKSDGKKADGQSVKGDSG